MRYTFAGVAAFIFLWALVFGLGYLWDSAAAVSPLPDGRLIVVAENLAVTEASVTTAYFETDDCRTFVVFADATTSLNVYLHPSPDGLLDVARVGGGKHSRVAGRSMTLFSSLIVAPLLAVEFERADTVGVDTVNKAWLFCTH